MCLNPILNLHLVSLQLCDCFNSCSFPPRRNLAHRDSHNNCSRGGKNLILVDGDLLQSD